TPRLSAIFQGVLSESHEGFFSIQDDEYRKAVGAAGKTPAYSGAEMWRTIAAKVLTNVLDKFDGRSVEALQRLLSGDVFSNIPLARRMLNRVGPSPGRGDLVALYRTLASDLPHNIPLAPTGKVSNVFFQ